MRALVERWNVQVWRRRVAQFHLAGTPAVQSSSVPQEAPPLVRVWTLGANARN